MLVVKVTIVEAITVEAGLAIVGMVVLEAVLGTVFVFWISSQSSQIFSPQRNWHVKKAEQLCKTSIFEWWQFTDMQKSHLAKLLFCSILSFKFEVFSKIAQLFFVSVPLVRGKFEGTREYIEHKNRAIGTLFVKNVAPPIWLDRDNLNSLKWTLTQKTELIWNSLNSNNKTNSYQVRLLEI